MQQLNTENHKIYKHNIKKKLFFLLILVFVFSISIFLSYYDSAQTALKLNPKYEKAQYHKIKSLILLNKIQVAQNLLKQKLIIEQKDRKYLESLINLINISQTKCYQLSQYWEKVFQLKNLQFGYVSYALQIRKGNYGLGLFANKDISANLIIIAEKPLIFLSKQEQNEKGLHDQRCMCQKVKQLISISPEFKKKLNLFQQKNIFLNLDQRQKQKTPSNKQMLEAVKLNWFQASQFIEQMCGKQKNTAIRSGLYSTVCLMNHRCERHCEYFFIGQQMLVRTIHPVKKGQQIYINYYYELQQSQRRRKLQNVWNIKCDCIFCIEQRKMDQKLIKPGYNNFHSQDLKLHLISSQIFFRGFDTQMKYIVLNNPQMRWKNVLNHHNQNQLKAKMIANMFKSPSIEAKLFEKIKKQSQKLKKNNQNQLDFLSSLKAIMKK